MKNNKYKKGISNIIGLFLIIILAIIVAAIVFFSLGNTLQNAVKEIDFKSFGTNINIIKENSYVNESESIAYIDIKRNPGGSDVFGIKFILENSTDSYSVTYNQSEFIFNELEEKLFAVDFTGRISNINKISVIPIILASSGSQKPAPMKDTTSTASLTGSHGGGGGGGGGSPGAIYVPPTSEDNPVQALVTAFVNVDYSTVQNNVSSMLFGGNFLYEMNEIIQRDSDLFSNLQGQSIRIHFWDDTSTGYRWDNNNIESNGSWASYGLQNFATDGGYYVNSSNANMYINYWGPATDFSHSLTIHKDVGTGTTYLKRSLYTFQTPVYMRFDVRINSVSIPSGEFTLLQLEDISTARVSINPSGQINYTANGVSIVSSTLSSNQWHSVEIKYGSTIELYVDNVLVNNKSITARTSITNYYIGTTNANNLASADIVLDALRVSSSYVGTNVLTPWNNSNNGANYLDFLTFDGNIATVDDLAQVGEKTGAEIIFQIPVSCEKKYNCTSDQPYSWDTLKYWADFVQYLTGTADADYSTKAQAIDWTHASASDNWADLRAARGRVQPYNLTYLEIGNEPYYVNWNIFYYLHIKYNGEGLRNLTVLNDPNGFLKTTHEGVTDLNINFNDTNCNTMAKLVSCINNNPDYNAYLFDNPVVNSSRSSSNLANATELTGVENGVWRYTYLDDAGTGNGYSSIMFRSFANKWVDQALSIKQVNPNLKLGLPGGQAMWPYTLPLIVARNNSIIDWIAVHTYGAGHGNLTPTLFPISLGYGVANASKASSSYIYLYPNDYQKALEAKATYLKNKAVNYDNIFLSVTEYNCDTAQYLFVYNYLYTSIYISSIIGTLLDLGYKKADFFMLDTSGRFDYGVIGDKDSSVIGRDITPSYYVLDLWKNHFGDTEVKTTTVNSTKYYWDGGGRAYYNSTIFEASSYNNDSLKYIYEIPYLSVWSAKKDNKLYILAVNRNMNESITANINLTGFSTKQNAVIWQVNGSSPLDFNQIDATEVISRNWTINYASSNFNYTFPKLSVTSIELTQR